MPPSLIGEEEEEEQKRGEGRVLSHGAIRWKDRNNSFKLLNPYVCYELLMHTHKRIIYDKNTLQGTLKESIKHFKYKILKSYMYNKSIMSYKKLNSLNKWGDNPCL